MCLNTGLTIRKGKGRGPEGSRGLQEVKVTRFRDNGTGWW